MKRTIATCLALLFTVSLALPAATDDTTTYQEISGHYEAIRLALLEDSLAGVKGHAEDIEKSATMLATDFSAAQAGVAADQAGECRDLLPEISTAARQLVDASDLAEVREAFFELSKPLGRYRKLTGDLDSKVAYCPMAKKAWIQPESGIGNPYMGTDMPSCGRIVAD